MSNLRCAIYTLGNSKYGLGHKVRSHALASHFSKEWDVKLIDIESDSEIMEADISILDLPAQHESILDSVKRKSSKVVALDYFGPLNFDLVISVFEHYGKLPGNRVSGLEYVIIREEMKNLKRSEQDYVLVSIGGADINNKSAYFAQKILNLNLRAKVVFGKSADARLDLPGVEIFKSPSHFPELMAGCAWGITNGGGTMLEMVHLHKPAYVYPQTKFEENLSNYLLEKNLILGIYPSEINTKKKLEFGINPIDGYGPERIKSQLKVLL